MLVSVSWRCLIVDDNNAFCQTAADLLQRQGVEVVGTASSVAEALDKAIGLRPNVCQVDVDLGGDSGFTLAARLASMPAVQPLAVVLVSSYTETDFSELIATSPAVGFLSKSRLSAQALVETLDGRAPRDDARDEG